MTATTVPVTSWSSPVRAATRPPARWFLRPWNGVQGLVCLDPSAEVVRLVYGARQGLRHRVVALNPEDPRSDSFNALDWIETSTDRALIDIQAVVGWLCGETPGQRYDDYFKHAARALLGCLLADLIFDPAIPP